MPTVHGRAARTDRRWGWHACLCPFRFDFGLYNEKATPLPELTESCRDLLRFPYQDEKLIYVGLSRARFNLYILETESASSERVNLFFKRRLANDR